LEQKHSLQAKRPKLLKKFTAVYGTRRFIAVFAKAPTLSHIDPVYASHPASQISILILSSHLSLGLPSGLLPSGFPTKALYAPLLSPIRATCPAHLSLLDFITGMILDEKYRA
jgi:hypothetical protein